MTDGSARALLVAPTGVRVNRVVETTQRPITQQMAGLAQSGNVEILAPLRDAWPVRAAIRAFAAGVFGALVAVIAIAGKVDTDEEDAIVRGAELAVVAVAGGETLGAGIDHQSWQHAQSADGHHQIHQAWFQANVLRATHPQGLLSALAPGSFRRVIVAS